MTMGSAEWLGCPTANAKVAAVPGSISASYIPMDPERR
jgi:hypothetical protein